MTKIAINGYGRIGRNILRAFYESDEYPDLEIVAINDLGDAETNAHLTQYDTTHGKFSHYVRSSDGLLHINNDEIRVLSIREPNKLPWAELDVDVVFECTGFFRSREKAELHIEAGAKKVIISAPGSGEVDATVVYGVNHATLKASDVIISNASCTTNCLAPLAKILNDSVGIESGLMTTVHAYTNDQVLTDVYHTDLYRARSATSSLIPTTTGAAAAVGKVIPELVGKLDGFAIRVPTLNVSIVDLTFVSVQSTSVNEVNEIVRTAADNRVLAYNNKPLVSVDFNHTSTSSNYDASLTKLQGEKLVKVCAWYDNEWGFSNRMLDTAKYVASI